MSSADTQITSCANGNTRPDGLALRSLPEKETVSLHRLTCICITKKTQNKLSSMEFFIELIVLGERKTCAINVWE